ncbi:MAG TPA: hypothetical protein PLT36_05180 [Erysipelotrichaceae bacterium]|mgnify:FL=1|nr:hypothetical protein [Erysipelotrichaceae bacterium]HQA84736.1 hypothetical protein [Erysipelotrichaceae bacterium]
MNQKEIFLQELNNYKFSTASIVETDIESALKEIDRIYGVADSLSIKNGKKHRYILLLLSIGGTILTFMFLLYDELEFYGLIIACGVMVLCLLLLNFLTDKLDCHRKYLQYRILAEALRLQYFLSLVVVETRVVDILPWSLRKGIGWIEEILKSLPQTKIKNKHSILQCWIIDQRKYHERALAKTEIKNYRDKTISKMTTIITIGIYFVALIFELFVFNNEVVNINIIRMILKILLGTMSAITLFLGSYYGKMSLSNAIEDHKRMIELYKKAQEDVVVSGESEELILSLAREFLNENSAWYSYQQKNRANIVI